MPRTHSLIALSVGGGLALCVLVVACSGAKETGATGSGGADAGAGGVAGMGGMADGGGGLGGDAGAGGRPPVCEVAPDGNDGALIACQEETNEYVFDAEVQWSWTAPAPAATSLYAGSFITPLVGNFTDDDGNGTIDLCDTPDVLVSALQDVAFGGDGLLASAKLFLLAGDTGDLITELPVLVDGFVTPAFADIDGDGLPEIVTADTLGRVVAFEHDGTLKWTGDTAGFSESTGNAQCPTVALYDLDNDGDVEILLSFEVFDHLGNRLWGHPGNGAEFDGQYWCVTPTAADLDGDDDLEVLFGHVTYSHDGTLLWQTGEPPSHPHVANLDGDMEPEILLTNLNGLMIVEHDGTTKLGPVRPTDPSPSPSCWGKPTALHQIDSNSSTDVVASTCSDITMYEVGPSELTLGWSNGIANMSGLAGTSMFDFLGHGRGNPLYATDTHIHILSGLGLAKLSVPRSSLTLIEYPVAADVDNDASAEMIYVSNYPNGETTGPTVTVLSAIKNNWVRARRIWNQYAYHVTNVREDATIPQVIKRSWRNLNTFRANSQIRFDGRDCVPSQSP